MKLTFAAFLTPGVPAKILDDDEARSLDPTSAMRDDASARPPSFVYASGPGAATFASPDGRFAVAVSGHCVAPGGASPAEWIVDSFTKRSTECFTDLNGTWRLVLVDNERGALVAATDRMGSRRVCFASTARGHIAVGHDSEIVARLLGSGKTINENSLLNYFYFHFIPSPATLFADIASLPPAEFVSFAGRSANRGRYWNPRFASSAEPQRVEPAELLAALTASVADLCAPRRVATFLSGGLDSSTVVGLAARHRGGAAVAPYTIGFDEPAYDETRYARIAADHFDVRLNRYEVTPQDVIDAIAEIAAAYDEPFGNSSAIPTFFCAKAAALAGETTMLAGDGGDELFAGNARYRTQTIFARYDAVPAALRRSVLEPIFLGLFAKTQFFPLRKVRRYIEQARLPMPDRMQSYNFLVMHGMERVFTDRFLEAVDAKAPIEHLREVYAQCAAESLVDRMLYLDWKLTLADNDLRKVTTMCEAAGVEVLFPMLDNRLIDLACRIPGDVKLRHGNLRDFFKKSVSSVLPKEIITKTKHGFGLPFGPWFSRSAPLRKHVTDKLDGLLERGIVRPDYIEFIRKATLEEHAGYYGEMLWLMCVLESWLAARPRWAGYKL
jgi:asparagine synthase (glutamine-hydrolysing)